MLLGIEIIEMVHFLFLNVSRCLQYVVCRLSKNAKIEKKNETLQLAYAFYVRNGLLAISLHSLCRVRWQKGFFFISSSLCQYICATTHAFLYQSHVKLRKQCV